MENFIFCAVLAFIDWKFCALKIIKTKFLKFFIVNFERIQHLVLVFLL